MTERSEGIIRLRSFVPHDGTERSGGVHRPSVGRTAPSSTGGVKQPEMSRLLKSDRGRPTYVLIRCEEKT